MPESDKLTAERKYRLLLDIAEKIRGTLDLEQVLKNLIGAVRALVDCDAAGIFVLNRSLPGVDSGPLADMIAGVALHGFPHQNGQSDPMLRSGKGIVGHVIRTGEKLVIPDVRLDPRYVEGRSGTLSEIAVPITVGDRVIGAVNLESDRVAAFGEPEAELLTFISNAAALSIEKAILHRQLLVKRRLEHQMLIAKEVQTGLLPQVPPSIAGYDLAGVHLPSFEIGGDYFDYLELNPRRLGVAIADVSGKGVPAALIMATFRAAFRIQILHETRLRSIMGELNRLLFDSGKATSFVTAVCGALDVDSGEFSYVNCGHNPPLILRAGGGTEALDRAGLVMGIMPEVQYEEASAAIGHGDALVLFTDGVVEVTNRNGDELGADGLEKIIRWNWNKPAAEIIKSVVASARRFGRGGRFVDDFTLVIVRRA